MVEAPAAVAAALRIAPGANVIQMARLRLIEDAPVLTEDIWLPLDRFAAFADLPLDSIGDLLYPVYEAKCNQVVASATET